MARDSRHIVLVGLMGAGKSTIGRRVAKRLDRPFVDSDDVLEHRTGKTAREILAEQGVDAMHKAEADAIRDALDGDERNVIGAPASIVLDPQMRERLRNETVVWLRADPHWLAEKARKKMKNTEHRPFVDQDPDVLVRQHEERKALYEEVASYVADTTRRKKGEVAKEIVANIT
jgi:shikimate kinase